MKIREIDQSSEFPVLRLAVIGSTGRVGARVVELIESRAAEFAAVRQKARIVFAANSRVAVADSAGNAATILKNIVGTSVRPHPDSWFKACVPHVVIDCTASAEIASHYPNWLERGIDVVTPNKHASSSDHPLHDAIVQACDRSGAELHDATTVGAQLPLLATLRELRRAGDRIGRFEAVLSGTLSYVLGSVQVGRSLSQSIGQAVDLGYAEPDPACDLSGADAARKLVILLRAGGIEIELKDIECVPLLDAGNDTWHVAAVAADDVWRARTALAQARREKWIYRASYENGRARIAPERVSLDHPLARLAPCENALILHSDYYCAAPLTIAGPGAGIELTAAGVFSDLFAAARRHSAFVIDSNVVRLAQPLRTVTGSRIGEALAAT